jgi:GNAT superfamily N-acetyltransferase
MPGHVRPAARGDIPGILDVCEAERDVQARQGPRVWRRKTGSREWHAEHLAEGVPDDPASPLAVGPKEGMLILVHESAGAIDGVCFAAVVDGPPIWDPGGKVCHISEITLAPDRDWATTGATLLRETIAAARERGAVAALVNCADHERAKRRMLDAEGYGPCWGYVTRDLSAAT